MCDTEYLHSKQQGFEDTPVFRLTFQTKQINGLDFYLGSGNGKLSKCSSPILFLQSYQFSFVIGL